MTNEAETAVDAPLRAPDSELMHNQPGISVPAVDRPVHLTVDREEWVPEGMPAELSQPMNKNSPLYYAEHVGRAGVLAAALGVGAAIAGTAGVASAAPAKADTTTSAPSTPTATKGSSAAEHTAKANSRLAGPTRANSTTTTSPSRGHGAEENTTRDDSRSAAHTSHRGTNSRSETTETESAGVGSDETAPDETATSGPSTSDAATSETPVVGAASTTDAAPVSAMAAKKVVVPLASSTSQASPTVQAAQTPLRSRIFPWVRPTPTPSPTPTPAPAPVPSHTPPVASSTPTPVPQSTAITLPASATVFTLRGRSFGADTMEDQLEGIFAEAPYTLTKLNYTTWAPMAINQNIKMLDDALMSTSGNIIVSCHSEGSQIATRWMIQYANDPSRAALAGRVTFVLTGNPVRSTGGKDIGVIEGDPLIGVATPTNNPWAVIDVARRWERWADIPADPTNLWAAANNTTTLNTGHMSYDEVDLFDPTNTVWHEGNTTFVLTHENTVPLIKGYANAPADFVNAVRAEIEAAYTRPSADTPVTVQPIQSQQWQQTFNELVLKYGDPAHLVS